MPTIKWIILETTFQISLMAGKRFERDEICFNININIARSWEISGDKEVDE